MYFKSKKNKEENVTCVGYATLKLQNCIDPACILKISFMKLRTCKKELDLFLGLLRVSCSHLTNNSSTKIKYLAESDKKICNVFICITEWVQINMF